MKRTVITLSIGILGLFCLLAAVPASGQAGSEVPELNLPWPYDFEIQQGIYSRDLVFNDKAAAEYLDRARVLYMKGYGLLKKYEGVKESPDPFLRDPYKVFVREVHTLSFRYDFVDARNYFYEAYAIFTEGLQFDTGFKQKPEYKDLLRKILKGIIQTSIYMKELFVANGYLDTYASLYSEDKDFVVQYRIKIVSMLVDLQAKHEIMFFGDKSADSLRQKYQLLVQSYVEGRSDLDAKTKAWIIDRAAPKWSVKDFNTRSIDTNYGK